MATPVNLTAVTEFYREAFAFYDKSGRVPEINVEVYPYVGINHTIRVREGRVFVRIGEICRDMPAEAHRGLAYVLVSKLYRRRVPAGARQVYADFIKSDHIRERAAENRRSRGRKVLSGTRGAVYDLDEIFDRLNKRYFKGKLQKPVLSWSARKTYRILGHHDATHDTIVISRSLDSKETPPYVIDYVMFHEMLHVHHPTVHHNGRRYNHTAAFRRDEQKFDFYLAAEMWIEQNVRQLKRKAKTR
jgi:predicted metal-dependent hydrolase